MPCLASLRKPLTGRRIDSVCGALADSLTKTGTPAAVKPVFCSPTAAPGVETGIHSKDGQQVNDAPNVLNGPMPTQGIASEMGLMLHRGREVWRLVPRRHKWALAGAAVVMACTSACSTALALFLGQLVDGVQRGTLEGQTGEPLFHLAAWYLGLIGGAYLLREILNVLRRYLVTNTCTRINRDMSLQLMSHLMSVSLATLQCEKVGTLHGRIFRSVDGLVRFLRLNFMDFIPALFTGLFALVATVSKEPMLGLVMVGVIPMTIILTVRQLLSQKGIRLQLMRSCEEIDGAVVEQLGGIEYVRAADTKQLEMDRLARATEKRRAMEVRHHFQMSLFGCAKALNEGLIHILILGVAIYLAVMGRITFGEVLTFSLLFLNLMTPLGEIHRVLDEGHESSLQVGELLAMLAEPIDPSFATTTIQIPRLQSGEPAIVVDNLRVEYSTPEKKSPRTLHGISLTIRHGETIGIAGRSGGGKSTFLKVLLRLLHPCGGRVLVGAVPLEAVSRAVGQLRYVASPVACGQNGPNAPDVVKTGQDRTTPCGYVRASPPLFSPGRSPRTSPTATRNLPRMPFAALPRWHTYTRRSC